MVVLRIVVILSISGPHAVYLSKRLRPRQHPPPALVQKIARSSWDGLDLDTHQQFWSLHRVASPDSFEEINQARDRFHGKVRDQTQEAPES